MNEINVSEFDCSKLIGLPIYLTLINEDHIVGDVSYAYKYDDDIVILRKGEEDITLDKPYYVDGNNGTFLTGETDPYYINIRGLLEKSCSLCRFKCKGNKVCGLYDDRKILKLKRGNSKPLDEMIPPTNP